MIIKNPLQKELFALQDKEYRDFTAKLIPNVDKEKIIGIRVPILRKFAKEFYKDKLAVEEFLSDLPHDYYEENLLRLSYRADKRFPKRRGAYRGFSSIRG